MVVRGTPGRNATRTSHRETRQAGRASIFPHLAAPLALFLVWCLVPTTVLGQTVNAELDRSRTVLGHPVTLTIRVEGGTSGSPRIPDLDDWSVQYIGQETSISAVNLSITRSVAFNYLFTPLKTGSLTIPPISVKVDGKTLQTQQLQVLVTKGQPRSSSGSRGMGGTGAPAPGGFDAQDDVIVELEVDPPVAYVGQMVRETLRILTAVPLGDSIQVSREKVAGAVEEEAVNGAQRRYTTTRNGRSYRVEEVSWVFYPVKPGTLQISSIDVTVPVVVRSRYRRRHTIDPFFDSFFGAGPRIEPRGYRTEERSVLVRPVPAEGRPAGYRGLVGRFTVTARASDTNLRLGDSSTVTITVQGEGNLRNLTLPPLEDGRFKVYDDSPEVTVRLDDQGRVMSVRQFKRAVVPQVSGDLELPGVRIVYFNPNTGRFETATSDPVRLHVAPGERGERTLAESGGVRGVGKTAVEVTGEDILPIHMGPELAARRGLLLSSPMVLLALGLAPGLFFVSTGVARVRRKRYGDEATRRRRMAYRVARRGLKEARNAARRGEREGLEVLSKVLRAYLGDKLGVQGGALVAQEVQDLLTRAGVPETLARDAATLLDELEHARYAPDQGGDPASRLLPRTRRLLASLEKELE